MTQAKQHFAQAWHIPIVVCALAVLAACDPVTQGRAVPPEPGVQEVTRNGPADAAPGTCWGRTISPAVIERVTNRVLVRPAKVNPDGTIAKPPFYRTQEQQIIVVARRDNWFETPCPDVLTAEFNASLQRALQARGAFSGAVNGKMDKQTRNAIRRVQLQDGLDSGVLSLATARLLGLVAVPRDSTE